MTRTDKNVRPPVPAMISVRLLNDAPASGAWNMAVDESLLVSAAEDGICTLRFYGWEVPTLSLGYFQEYADRERHEASQKCPCVRRASGGGAIMHDREITYSYSVPPTAVWAKRHLALYEAFHGALIEVLADVGFSAALSRPPGSLRDQASPFLCFERRAFGDVLVGEAKIAGSAQRRFNGAVVQHGSILIERSPCAPELPGLNDLDGGRESTEDELLTRWQHKLAEGLELYFSPGELTDIERTRADRLTAEKYAADGWNCRRERCN